jgi:peptidoglycan hydrolase-like protein with peptidoglycan-binding domain
VYCSAYDWPAVQSEFTNQGVHQPMYWIAHWDGIASIPDGAVAKQYKNDIPPGYDVSITSDVWPVAQPTPTPPTPTPPSGDFNVSTLSTLQEGAIGPEVGSAQALLVIKHSAPIRIDSIFGPQTKMAVTSYQQFKNLQVDGIVGPQTWTALLTT